MKKTLFILGILLISGCATSINRQEYINKHPQLTENIKQNILTSKICIGMNKEQVKISWGEPSHITTTTSTLGTTELWFYGNYSSCLSFADEKLVMIQQSNGI